MWTLAKKNSKGLKKYPGQYGSEKFNQGKLAKKLYVHKHDKVSPIKYGTEPSSEKVASSSKFKMKINGTATMKLDGVSLSTELHLEKKTSLDKCKSYINPVAFQIIVFFLLLDDTSSHNFIKVYKNIYANHM